MYYGFLDESLKDNKRMTAAVLVSQGHYNTAIKLRNHQKGTLFFEDLNFFLKKVNGVAVVCRTDLDDGKLHARKDDRFIGVDRPVPRVNTVWLLALAYPVAGALGKLARLGYNPAILDIYHDPVSVNPAFRRQWEDLFRNEFPQMLRKVVGSEKDKFLGFRVRHIRSVTKKRSGAGEFTKFQRGVVFADRLARYSDPLPDGLARGDWPRLSHSDVTGSVLQTIQQFGMISSSS